MHRTTLLCDAESARHLDETRWHGIRLTSPHKASILITKTPPQKEKIIMAKSRETMPAWEQELEREWDKLGLSEEDRKDPIFQMQRKYRE